MQQKKTESLPSEILENKNNLSSDPVKKTNRSVEVGGPSGPEPTRYGDWEISGRCSDF